MALAIGIGIGIGIVGLPNVGKSTLFNALTSATALVANYPFATIEPNVGIAVVKDERLDVLAKLSDSIKIIPATVNITDIAGLVAGASSGEGLGNQFLSHVRSCQAIIQVVRAFNDPNVTKVNDQQSPKIDIETINTELVLADLQTVNRRLVKVEKEAKSNPKLGPMVAEYNQALKTLDSGQPLWTSDQKFELLDDLQLLTRKSVIYLFNLDDNELSDQKLKSELQALVDPVPSIFMSAKLEAELSQLDESDRIELLASYGQESSGLDQLAKVLYDLLGLQSFYTTGSKETRAWTIKQGSTAPEAAGAIHGDFERGFIAAEVIGYQDLVNVGSLKAARAAGKIRTEGKSYVLKDDDVVEFRFNVSK